MFFVLFSPFCVLLRIVSTPPARSSWIEISSSGIRFGHLSPVSLLSLPSEIIVARICAQPVIVGAWDLTLMGTFVTNNLLTET